MSMRASVVIASRNRRLHLEKCLECLCNQDCSPDAYEIIVVDDASTDDTWSMLESHHGPCEIRTVRLPESVGCGAARNAVIPDAAGDVIIFIDDDAFACPGYVREHLASHERSPLLIVDGPAINIAWDGSDVPLPFGSFVVRAQAFMDFAGATFVTANTSCRKEYLVASGGFDAEISRAYGWEDQELGHRLRRMGLTRVKNRSAVALHCAGTRVRADVLLSKRRQCGSNAVLFYNRQPEPSVRRQIRLDRLERLDTLNTLCRLIRAEVVNGEWRARWPLKYPAARLMLQREYAIGLSEGIERHGLPEAEVRR